MTFKLVFNPPINDKKELPVSNGILICGRDADADLVFPSGRVSRKHLRLECEGTQLFATDLGSTNGTYVNNQKIEKMQLKHNDVIRIGDFSIKVVGDDSQSPASKPSTSSIQDSIAELVEDDKVSVLKELKPADKGRLRDSIRMQALKDNADGVSINDVASDSAISGKLTGNIKEKDADAIEIIQRRLTLLYEIGQILTSELDIDRLLNLLMEMIFGVLPIEHGFIMMVDSNTKGLIPRCSRQRGGGVTRFAVSRTITNQVIEKKTSILTSDAMTDARFSAGASIAAFKIRSAMCCPIIIKDNIEGIIYVDNSSVASSFSEEDLAFLTAISSQAAVALENAKLFKSIEEATRLKNNLQRYLSPSIVEEIIKKNAPPEVGGDKKGVSVLFADIRNFTKMTALVKPLELCAQLNEYFNAMTKTIFKYEGTLDKFIGDEVMAVFGAPFGHDNDADRVIFTAIDMCNALQDLTTKWNAQNKAPFEIGIGIASGSAICGNFGADERMDYTCVGDTVNIAKRLTEQAHPNQILIDQKTFEQNHGGFKTNKILPVRMKGKTDAVKVYEVLH